MRDDTYKLDELARAAGISPRTVRYYVQRGLLPAPAFKGKDTSYGREHLVRLRAIRKLQDAFFPLDAIAAELERRSLPEIEHIADGAELPSHALQVHEAPPIPPPMPRPTPRLKPPSTSLPPRVFHRFEIAPGVELSIADDAPAESRKTAEKILESLHREDREEGA